jgi:uncharacterized protein (DUF433 family)
MNLTIAVEQIPLASDADGVIRVAGTRLPLDNIIIAFNQGATAEEIFQRFPVVSLADIYAVISYYLHHRTEIDAYLEIRNTKTKEIKDRHETEFNSQGIRARLLARRSAEHPEF